MAAKGNTARCLRFTPLTLLFPPHFRQTNTHIYTHTHNSRMCIPRCHITTFVKKTKKLKRLNFPRLVIIIIVTMTSQRGHGGDRTAEGRWDCFRNDNSVLQSLHTEGSLQGEGNVGNTRGRRIKSDARGVAGAFRKQSSPFGRCSNCVKVLLRPSPPGPTLPARPLRRVSGPLTLTQSK